MAAPEPPPVPLRPMRSADIEPLRWVIYRSYLQVLVELYGPDSATGYEVRSPEFMELYLRRDPDGCFVAEAPGGAPAGAVFCFVWGEVGWFGSLAVAPEWQGRGIGQALTRQAMAYLRERGCRRLGLETWPHSALVRHLYGKLGFRPVRSTIKFSRPVATSQPERAVAAGGAGGIGGGDEADVAWLGEGGGAALEDSLARIGAVTAAQAAASPGEPWVDYRLEVATPVACGWADVAVAGDGHGAPAGFVLCYLRRPGGGPVAALDVRLMGVTPGRGAVAVLDRLLRACDARAVRGGLSSVTVDVNLRHAEAAALLRARRFRPVYELLRMERPVPGFDPDVRSPLLDYSRWAG